GINEKRLREQVVAVHLVRIAEPKEGPSAGLAFVVGIVSALTGRPVKPGCAMTGEVTLHGEITGVGGLSHKVRAAARAGRKRVLIPADNAKDVAQVSDTTLAQVEIVRAERSRPRPKGLRRPVELGDRAADVLSCRRVRDDPTGGVHGYNLSEFADLTSCFPRAVDVDRFERDEDLFTY